MVDGTRIRERAAKKSFATGGSGRGESDATPWIAPGKPRARRPHDPPREVHTMFALFSIPGSQTESARERAPSPHAGIVAAVRRLAQAARRRARLP